MGRDTEVAGLSWETEEDSGGVSGARPGRMIGSHVCPPTGGRAEPVDGSLEGRRPGEQAPRGPTGLHPRVCFSLMAAGRASAGPADMVQHSDGWALATTGAPDGSPWLS